MQTTPNERRPETMGTNLSNNDPKDRVFPDIEQTNFYVEQTHTFRPLLLSESNSLLVLLFLDGWFVL